MTVPDLIGALDVTHAEQPIPSPLKSRRPRRTNKGRQFAPDPFRIEELVPLLRTARQPWNHGETAELVAIQRYSLYVLLWRTGLRISEALALEERDMVRVDRSVTVRRGKGGKRRTVKMDEWGWQQLDPWRQAREQLPVGTFFCVIRGHTAGTPLFGADVRRQMRECGHRAGLRRRIHPHAFRHTHAVELWREGIDVYAIQTQLGHARLDVTAAYLRSMGADDILKPIANRPSPTMTFALAV